MVASLPKRLAGYGAYNLCFDNLLGRLNAGGTNFFKTIRQQLNLQEINLVRVICFRNSQVENLPLDRAIPLYPKTQGTNPTGKVNDDFRGNLETLVKTAQAWGFWVEVSIFHYHAIATPKGTGNKPKPELPENLPSVLALDPKATRCERLKNFFNPAESKALAAQKLLANTIVTQLKSYPKVIYEIGNELRMDGDGCTREDNCRLAQWMNIIKGEILSVNPNALVGTSTGNWGNDIGANEEEIFRDCPQILAPNYFDFHSMEWIDDEKTPRIKAAAGRARDYLHLTPMTAPPLIINDDGLHDVNRIPPNIQKWATSAFGQGLHYATKGTYPNGGTDDQGQILDFDRPLITALNDAAKNTP